MVVELQHLPELFVPGLLVGAMQLQPAQGLPEYVASHILGNAHDIGLEPTSDDAAGQEADTILHLGCTTAP